MLTESQIYAVSSSINSPFSSFQSIPSYATCSTFTWIGVYTKTCAYHNLTYGYMFLYDLGSSSCNELSCSGAYPEAIGYFNPNGPYAQITLSRPSIML